MTNTMKEKLANALSEARYEVRMRLSNLEVALEQCKREEENLLDMEANHERLVKEWEEAKTAATVAKENENSLAEQKKSFFTSIDTSKKVSFKDMEEEYQKLCKELTSATRKATKAENKASTLGEELLQLEAAILTLVPEKEELKEEQKPVTKASATSVPAVAPTTSTALPKLPLTYDKETHEFFGELKLTTSIAAYIERHPFKKYLGYFVALQKNIRDDWAEAMKRNYITENKEYVCTVHVLDKNPQCIYVDEILDGNGTPIISTFTDVAPKVHIPSVEELSMATFKKEEETA